MSQAPMTTPMPAPMPAQMCVGRVLHARRALRQGEHASSVRHGFAYPVGFVAVPLSAWGSAQARPWLAYDRSALVALHARDHGARDGSNLSAWIAALLAREGITAADGEIVLQSFPRVAGLVFNPVSFWFCHDRAGALRAVLAEVNNTFGEHHNYLVAHADQRPISATEVLPARKVFHVSPFYPVAGEYRFRFDITSARRRVEIDYYLDGERALHTAVEGRTHPLDGASARQLAFSFPLLAVGVLSRIHVQALRLWLKGAFFFRKPAPPLQETTR